MSKDDNWRKAFEEGVRAKMDHAKLMGKELSEDTARRQMQKIAEKVDKDRPEAERRMADKEFKRNYNLDQD